VRPLRLKIKAFGPYSTEQILDFSILSNCSIFLIHGPTGAGKTSILDAICFALYGNASGSDRQLKYMRSDYALSHELTEVSFDFKLGQKIYRVFRRPEQQRPKKRGKGNTREPSKAILWKLVCEPEKKWSVVISGWDRVNKEIERLLGFKSDQFRQVVILPQGEFRRLLSAKSSERQQILEVLFQTYKYKRLEDALKEEASKIESDLERLREKIENVLTSFDKKDINELKALQNYYYRIKEKEQKMLNTLRSKESEVVKRLNEARIILERFSEFKKAKETLDALEEKRRWFLEKEKILNKAQRAYNVKDLYSSFIEREKELNNLQKEIERKKLNLNTLKEKEKEAKDILTKEEQYQKECEDIKREIDELKKLQIKLIEYQEVSSNFLKTKEDVKHIKEKLFQKEKELLDIKNDLESLRKQREEFLKKAIRLENYQSLYKELSAVYKNKNRLTELKKEQKQKETKLLSIQKEISSKEKAYQILLEEFDRLEETWIKAQAFFLADRLEPGKPCPVCGSISHPNPASYKGELPDKKLLKKKKKEIKELDELIKSLKAKEEDINKAKLHLDVEIKQISEFLSDYKDVSETDITNELSALEEKLVSSKKAKDMIPNLENEIANKEKLKTKLAQQIEDIKNQYEDKRQELIKLEANLYNLKKDIPKHLRNKDILENTIKEKETICLTREASFKKAKQQYDSYRTKVIEETTSLEHLERDEIKIRNILSTLNKSLNTRVKKLGFKDIEELKSSVMTDEEIERLKEEVQDFKDSLGEAKKRLERIQNEIKGLEKPELEPLKKEQDKIKAQIENTIGQLAHINEVIKQINKAFLDINKISEEYLKKEKQYGIVKRLADVASGKNRFNISLERFVLASLLDDVLAAASKRLRIMSKGRFDLQRLIDIDDKRKASGLDIGVYDSYTGTLRPVNTLSGGESFLASLSLALGLSDVVQSYAGGIKLDTIFIDEGFGSLDQESLDLALSSLLELRKEGRLVGIISHIPELKERIDVRLEVIPNRQGSIARFVS